MSETIISVVIPTYNSSKFITKTLDCLKTQIFKDFAVVVINDGSTDDTQEVILRFIETHPDLNIKLFSQENKGIAGARNRGILEAGDRYIAFLDHDDIWYPEKLDKCYDILKKYPEVSLVCHDEIMKDASGRIIQYLKRRTYGQDMFRDLLFRGNRLSTSAVVVKKDTLLKTGLFREYQDFSTVEDYDLWLRLSKKYKFYFIKEILGEYIINERNASLNFERHYNNQINMLRLNFKEYSEKRIFDFFLINFRIAKIYFIIARHFLREINIGLAGKYFLKAALQFFRFRYA